MRYAAAVRVLVVLLLLLAAPARAQESGGSFGGSSWDDEPSGGGGGGGWEPSGGGGGGGSSTWESDRAAEREAEARREAEAAAARAAEEARRRAEEEARRRAEEARRARIRALPPIERAREVGFPPAPASPALPDTHAVTTTFVPRPVRFFVAVAPPEPATTARFRAPYSWGTAACCGGGLALFLLPITLLLTWPWRKRTSGAPAGPSGLARRVTLAFDWTARAALQGELKAMAQRVDTRTRPGLHRAASEAVALLGAHVGAARYASWELSAADPRSWFQSRVTDLRSRFTTDRVRQIEGRALGAGGGEHVARPEEGQGLVVVTLLVASKAAMPFPSGVARAEDVSAVLAQMVPGSPDQMLALEVIWSPSEENDRMSSLELERFYPELMPLGSGVGRHVCGYCRAPFPLELGKCPTCGGPVARASG